jgi:spore coat protein U-like protein
MTTTAMTVPVAASCMPAPRVSRARFSLFAFALLAGLVASPAARATCTATGDTGTKTYNYTAANINSAAPLSFTASSTCRNPGNGNNIDASAHVCYRTIFTNNVASGGNTMTYAAAMSDGANNVANMTSNTIYGLFNTPVSGTTPLTTTLTLTVPAGQTAGKPAGTYSRSSIQFAFDEQGNGAPCEGHFTPSTAEWDTLTFNYTARFVIPTYCLLTSTSNVDFGNLTVGPLGAPVDATGGVSVQCSSGTAYTVYLGNGNQRIPGGNRQMKNGSALLAYQLYKNTAHSQVWDATGGTGATGGSGGVNGTGNGLNQSLTVHARIPAGTSVPGTIGNYTDTVVVTVTY